MKNPFDIMKQVQQMQERAQRLQEELAAMEISGEAGGGLVRVTLDGKGSMRGIRIDPSLMRPEETEILEDLIVAAAADAKGKVEAQMQSKMAELTGGLPLPPGLKLF
jgi:nucleoid-associated protein EbfC